jgi:hypothetical protein
MRVLAIALVVLGLIGVVYGGITWTQRDTVIDAGPIQVTKEKSQSLPLPPIAGAAMLVAGAVLLLKT